MDPVILLIAVGLVMLILWLLWDSWGSNVVYQKSSLDGRSYLVLDLPDRAQAADRLAQIRNKLTTIVKKLPQDDPRTQRVLQRWHPDQLSESPAHATNTSYTVNKGDRIYMCVRDQKHQGRILDLNTLTFVALHELAHVMTVSIGHQEDFWDNFRWLLQHSIKAGVYQYQDFDRRPVEYCGDHISHTPLNDVE